ncbi:glycosyltransferase [Rhodoferax sp. 4810]|uniref:Glycosyltransferase n=2 Tax=Thiospirillum jenense TaxID=1653858 RepID=A0A839HBJ4_9GAMM|nr:glycosyltransferase [Rhodoferax jenense]MBB1126071.1 glycosyltransferase [Thiospirillum jenense]
MFRIAKLHPLIVVSPKPWSPIDWLIRLRHPHFRPPAPRYEQQQGIDVYAPHFFSLPGILKQFDSVFMAIGSYATVRRLKRDFQFNLIDAHFGYPDGHAASLLARWFKRPLVVTLRGNEQVYVKHTKIRSKLITGLNKASKVVTVADALKKLAIQHGVNKTKLLTISNGVDSNCFYPIDTTEARKHLNLPLDAQILISVGRICEGKGFHFVIAAVAALCITYPHLHYLIIGQANGMDNNEKELRQLVSELQLEQQIHFLGLVAADQLKWALSAADLFVLATRREGWANVFLEAMACGLPVITTDVGGNAEVVNKPELGTIVPFGDHAALCKAIEEGLNKNWGRNAIRAYAEENSWDSRIQLLSDVFQQVIKQNTTCN